MKGIVLSIMFMWSGAIFANDPADSEILNKKEKESWFLEVDKRIKVIAKLRACVVKVKRKMDLKPCGVKHVKETIELNDPKSSFMKELNKY